MKSNLRSPLNLSPNLPGTERRSRSRSPIPHLKKSQTLAPERQRLTRSRSPTPNPLERTVRSRSGTPTSKKKIEKRDRSFVASNKDLTMHITDDGSVMSRSRSSSAGHRSRQNSQSSCRVPTELTKQASEELMSRVESLKERYNDEQLKRLDEQYTSESRKQSVDVAGVDYSPTHRVSENFRGTSHYCLLNTTPVDEIGRSPSPCFDRGGIDTSSACRVSENFIGTSQYHLLNSGPSKENCSSPERSGLDKTSSCKVFENLERTQQLTLRKYPSKGRSGVDTTPVSKVSENFVSTNRSRKCSASVNDLDLITKKEQNDSGSEVSDEGYKSLGLVSTPPANVHQSAVPPLPGRMLILYRCVT